MRAERYFASSGLRSYVEGVSSEAARMAAG
jgi:hypothetical protein